MTNSISEIENNDCLFITGSNTTDTHPVLSYFIKQAKRKGAKIIVAEPRKIDLVKHSDVFVQIKPGTNIALYNGMANYIYHNGLADQKYIESRTEGYAEFLTGIIDFTPKKAAKICGCKEEDIIEAAKIFASAKSAGIYYAMGVTQHSNGTNGVKSLCNLGLITGNIGKKNAGINPLRGQNNVQGACDMGGLPNNLTGYQKVFNDEARAKFEKAWDVKIDSTPGIRIPEMIEGMADGSVKFAYVMGENPIVSDPDTNHVKAAFEKVNFLVVQDMFLTETAEYADVVLPASSFAEKEGTFTNTERRVQMVNKAIEPVGNSKPDYMILQELMTVFGYQENKTPSEIMDEIASLTPIYSGINYDRLKIKGLQWPCTDKNHPGTKYLYEEKFTRKKALFSKVEYLESAEVANKEYPVTMTTGRTLYQYHTRTMTDKTKGINTLVKENYIEINSFTATKYNLTDGEMTTVTSRRGSIKVRVKVKEILQDDVCFMPFHFAEGANVLTNTAADQYCGIPELKVCAIKFNA